MKYRLIKEPQPDGTTLYSTQALQSHGWAHCPGSAAMNEEEARKRFDNITRQMPTEVLEEREV